MHKILLSLEQVEGLVRENKFPIDPHTVSLDGRGFLETQADSLRVFEEAAKQYGFVLDKGKLAKRLHSILPETPGKSQAFAGAVLMIEGSFAVPQDFSIETGTNEIGGSMCIYHRTVADHRLRLLAESMLDEGTIELMDNTDVEYLYQILTLVQDEYMFGALKQVAGGLPLYRVVFGHEGSFTIHEEGTV